MKKRRCDEGKCIDEEKGRKKKLNTNINVHRERMRERERERERLRQAKVREIAIKTDNLKKEINKGKKKRSK